MSGGYSAAAALVSWGFAHNKYGSGTSAVTITAKTIAASVRGWSGKFACTMAMAMPGCREIA